jgi:hypothetical protein
LSHMPTSPATASLPPSNPLDICTELGSSELPSRFSGRRNREEPAQCVKSVSSHRAHPSTPSPATPFRAPAASTFVIRAAAGHSQFFMLRSQEHKTGQWILVGNEPGARTPLTETPPPSTETTIGARRSRRSPKGGADTTLPNHSIGRAYDLKNRNGAD